MFSLDVLNVLNTLTLKQIFWKTKTFFKKLEYRFLVESTNVENTIFQYKIDLSETNVKTNSMGIVNWTYHKEQSCSSKYFIVLKMLIWCTNYHVHIYALCEGAFSLWVSLTHFQVHSVAQKCFLLTRSAGSYISKSCIKIKINLSFYFHTSLWLLKRFYEGL